jgi:hypothetical protein
MGRHKKKNPNHKVKRSLQRPGTFQRKRTIGELEIMLPEPPENIVDISGYDKYIYDQKFTPTPVPDDLDYMPKEERIAFIRQEMKRRQEGFWFYNCGEIEYITGEHYFYCNYWQIDVGLPDYRESDRDYFYFWDYCVQDPNCYGMMYICDRRAGKTSKACSQIYGPTSLMENKKSGIQSKTGGDAKEIFKKIVFSWKKLPDFWKPTDSGDTNPKGGLFFEEPSKRSSSGNRKKYKKVLNSEITWAPSSDSAYDGSKQLRLYHDEVGKATKEANVENRWYVCKPCLELGNKIVGKGLLTTTVEEIDKEGNVRCKSLWYDSDPNERPVAGRTITGLFRYFKPATEGLEGFIDEYGRSVIEDPDPEARPVKDKYGDLITQGSRSFLESKRNGLEGAKLSNEKRKYPFTIEEAFRIDNKDSEFDLDRVYAQHEHNMSLPESTVIRGNFKWTEEDKEVKFVHDRNGKWRVAWMPQEKDREVRNRTSLRYGHHYPGNTEYICAGVDPFDHKKTTDGRSSDASCHIRRMFDPMNPYKTKCFVAHYLARPPKPEIFYEDILMACFFYGCEILAETNKIGLNNYFRMRGYEKYLMKRPEPTHTAYSKKKQTEPGIPMTGDDARNALISAIQTEVYDNCGWLEEEQRYAFNPFTETLDDWIAFEVDNWTPFDSTVSSGLALLAERKYISTTKKREVKSQTTFVKKYNNKGVRSKRI